MEEEEVTSSFSEHGVADEDVNESPFDSGKMLANKICPVVAVC
jgi:hypothetical protein